MRNGLKIFLFYLSAVLINPSALSAEDTLKIGVIYGFSGAAEVWSDYGRMGLELARDEINNGGGVKGKKIQLIFEDSQTNPAKSVTAYRKLVAVDKVKIIIGNVWSFITNPLIPLSEKDKVILLSPTVMDASVEKVTPYFFTMGHKLESLHKAVDLFFSINSDFKSTAILCWEDNWGRAHLELWKKVAENKGINVVDEMCQNDFGNAFITEVTKLSAKKPDTVLVSMFGERVMQRMKDQKWNATILSTTDMVEAIKVRNALPGVVEGAYFTDWKPSGEWISKFKAKFGKEPILEAHNHYEALRAISMALNSGSDDVLSALKRVKYQGVGGEIDFSKGPFVNQGVAELYQIKNGEFVLVRD